MSASRSKYRQQPLKSLPDLDIYENCEKKKEDNPELMLPFKKRIIDKNGKENKTDGSPSKGTSKKSEAEETEGAVDSDSDSDFEDILRSMKKKGIKTEMKSTGKSTSGQKKVDLASPGARNPEKKNKEARKKLFSSENTLSANVKQSSVQEDDKKIRKRSIYISENVKLTTEESPRTPSPRSSKGAGKEQDQNENSEEIKSSRFASLKKKKKKESHLDKAGNELVEGNDPLKNEVDLALEEANKLFLKQLRNNWSSSKKSVRGGTSTHPRKKLKLEAPARSETPSTPVDNNHIPPQKNTNNTAPVCKEELPTSLKNKIERTPSQREAPSSKRQSSEEKKSTFLKKRKLPTPSRTVLSSKEEQSTTPLKKRKLSGLFLHEPPITPVCASEEGESVTPIKKEKLSVPSRREPPSTPLSKTVKKCSTPRTPLEEARVSLHVSAVPNSLPCREQEFKNILNFVENKVIDGVGGCMYISGVPGTGKTATVTQVMRHLQAASAAKHIPNFKYIEINGMRLSDPHQAYVQLYHEIFGKKDRISSSAAHKKLDAYFSKADSKKVTTVILVDELDLMCTRKQDVVYNLLDWPSKPRSRLVVLTIANTMDMPERKLKGRVNSRLGLTRLTFLPYTHKQLEEIVLARLQGTDAFVVDAVRLATRKVAAVSGDARRALDICRRAAELPAEDEPVRISHIEQTIKEMTNSNIVRLIRSCSEIEKLFLRSVSDVCIRTGLEEVDLLQVVEHLLPLCVLEGLQRPPVLTVLTVCQRLRCFRLIFTNNHRSGLLQRLTLNITQDDLHYAFKADN